MGTPTAIHDDAIDEARYAEAGARLCEQVLAQFTGETGLFHLGFRADLGEFHFMAERAAEGERVLLALIDDSPDQAVGYVRLAELLGCGARGGERAIDRQRTEKLLEEDGEMLRRVINGEGSC